MKHIKPWYELREDDVILTASFDITVGEACRRLACNIWSRPPSTATR